MTPVKVQPSAMGGAQQDRPASSRNVNPVEEEDTTYTTSVLGAPVALGEGTQRTLGILWNFVSDCFVIDTDRYCISS